MAKKTSVKDLLETLAKERGVELKAPTKKEKITGSGVIGKLEEGAGFAESFTETAKEKIQTAKEAVTTTKGIKSLGKKVYGEMFKGDDIFAAYMRGRLKKFESKRESSKESGVERIGGENTDLGSDSSAYLATIAKQSMAIPGMARDTNVLRQNLQQLVKIWGGTAATKKEVDEKLESKEERKADIDYFAEQDKKESELEAARTKAPTPAVAGGETKEPKKEEGLLGTIVSLFSSGFMKAISFIFNPKNLLKLFSKVFVPLTIVATLFSGIMDGFKKYQEGGSFTEIITSALGGMLKTLTFGLFGEDTIKKVFDSITNFFDKPLETITGIFRGIKDFFVGLFGGDVKVEDKTPAAAAKVTPESPKAEEVSAQKPYSAPPIETPKTSVAETVVAPAGVSPIAVKKESKETVGAPTKQPADGGESKRNESAKAIQKEQQARADVEALQIAEADLRELYKDWRDEKSSVLEKLIIDKKRFPDGVDDDPKSPEYPKELKSIDDQYNKWIGIKKSEIESYKKKPGVKEELDRQKKQELKLDELERMNDIGAAKKTPSKTAGTKFTTTEKVEVTGGAETKISFAKTPEAKKAEEDLKVLEKKQADERREAVAKAKSEGKITGRFATSKDFEEVGELKALKTKQEAERAELIKKIDEGTTAKVTTTGGSAAGAGGGAALAAGGAGGSAGGAGPASGVSPTAESTTPSGAPSGATISAESSKVAEQQRMESAADVGSMVNAPTTNNSMDKPSKVKSPASDAYDSDLVSRLATI